MPSPANNVDAAIAALAQAKEAVSMAVSALRDKVAGIPDLECVVRVSGNPSAFRISSKNISNACWDPFFYDFPKQGNYVAGLIDQAGAGNGKAALVGFLEKGVVIIRNGFNSRRLCFHPDFVAAVKPDVENAIRLADAFGGFSGK